MVTDSVEGKRSRWSDYEQPLFDEGNSLIKEARAAGTVGEFREAKKNFQNYLKMKIGDDPDKLEVRKALQRAYDFSDLETFKPSEDGGAQVSDMGPEPKAGAENLDGKSDEELAALVEQVRRETEVKRVRVAAAEQSRRIAAERELMPEEVAAREQDVRLGRVAWDEMDEAKLEARMQEIRDGEMQREVKEAKAAARQAEDSRYGYHAVKPTARRGLAGWLDWLRRGKPPPMTTEAKDLLASKESFTKRDMLLMHNLALRSVGMDVRAKERGIEPGLWKRINNNLSFKGVALTMGLAALAPALLAAAVGAAIPLGAIAGYAASAGLGKFVSNAFENAGYKKTGFILGIATGLLASAGVTGYFYGTSWVEQIWSRFFPGEAVSPPAPGVESSVFSPRPVSILNTCLDFPVADGSPSARFGIDGFVKSTLLTEPFFQNLHLSPGGQEQFIDVLRTVFTDNPDFAEQFMNADGRIIRGRHGLDLAFRGGDMLDLTIFQDSDFLTELKNTILKRESVLTGQLGGEKGVAQFIAKIGTRVV